MTEKQTRREANYEAVEALLDSDATTIGRRLYKREVDHLEKVFPEVEIKIGTVYKGKLYNCLISKK